MTGLRCDATHANDIANFFMNNPPRETYFYRNNASAQPAILFWRQASDQAHAELQRDTNFAAYVTLKPVP